jgi:hypothetical protein
MGEGFYPGDWRMSLASLRPGRRVAGERGLRLSEFPFRLGRQSSKIPAAKVDSL